MTEAADSIIARLRGSPLAGHVWRFLWLVLVYVLAARLVLAFAANDQGVSPVWPLSGILAASVVVYGVGIWPAIVVAELLTSLSVGVPLLGAFGLALANLLESVIAAHVVRRGKGEYGSFDSRRSLVRWGLVGGFGASLAAALVGAGALVLSGGMPAAVYLDAVGTWWLGDAIGLIVITPVLLVARRPPSWRWTAAVREEFAFAMLLLLVATAIPFFWHPMLVGQALPLAFLPFPAVTWLAVRFEQRGAAAGVLITYCIAGTATALGIGPFSAFDRSTQMILIQIYLLALGGMGHALAWGADRRRSLARDLRQSNAILRIVEKAQTEFIAAPDRSDALGRLMRRTARYAGGTCGFLAEYATDTGQPSWRLRGANWRCTSCVLAENSSGALATLLERVPAAEAFLHAPPVGIPVSEVTESDCPAIAGRFTVWPIRRNGVVRGAVAAEVGAKRPLDNYGDELRPVADTAATFLDALSAQDAARAEHELRLSVERQLRASQRLEAIGTLASGIAHEFNNVITGISANAELLQLDVGEDHPGRPSISEILKGTHRAADVTRQVLSFTRQRETKVAPMSLAPLVAEALNLMRATIPPNITVQRQLARQLPLVMADATAIHQVVVNLCTNAMHAMRERGGVLTVSLRPVADPLPNTPGAFLALEVRDTGHGMTDVVRERLFEPFFTTKPEGEGTGLGLSVVHGIVTSLSGHIIVESEVGSGATIRVFFPVAELATGAEFADAPVAQLPAGAGESIVVVDDEPSLLHGVLKILNRRGYVASGFSDPQAAVEAVTRRLLSADLLVTDLLMPGLSGVEVIERCRAVLPDLPVILMTGTSNLEATRYACDELGAALLSKPFDQRSLLTLIARGLQAVPQH